MNFRRPMLAVVTAGLMAVSLPNNALHAAEADIPNLVLIDPEKANQKPREEKISKSANRVVESDDWRKDTKNKIWKWHKTQLLMMNCTKDDIVVKTYNVGDGSHLIPKFRMVLKPGKHTSQKIKCASPKAKDECSIFVGTPKHGFIGWYNAKSNWGPNVMFGSAEHISIYPGDPTAVSQGCQSFKKHLNLDKAGTLPK